VTRVQRWERASEVPLLLLAAAFLIAYAWPILDPRIDPNLATTLHVASWSVWVAFALDFAARLYLAGSDRWSYAWRHWYDVALIALPMLRSLRVLRLLALARVLNRSATRSLVGRVTAYVVGVNITSVLFGALAVLDAEQQAKGANITAFGDAVWWACTTVSTVGYGDFYPVTTQGRVIAVALMIVGIATLGAVTAGIASVMIQQVQREQPPPGDTKAAPPS
jgi:voltage-gated potassium channel